ncbi:MAG: CDP-paratose 2-epimerase [Elusimicrobia bacterium GWA2_69_24]|nr:MAG: CDP-paratose 2-epimerase [Elusimicrobia bacterium GWA2_69_24]HBL17915.1 CDP-paratose 2-epimerase [Elusimicrobiota bacterium]
MKKSILITGGAGFIGVNAAWHFLRAGWRVSVFDDLSRRGAAENLRWLRSRGRVDFQKGDLRSRTSVERWVRRGAGADLVLHLAAQVAVTTSVDDPRRDFDINALGSLNLLEALRGLKGRAKPFILYASTNKVYGEMRGARVGLHAGRYRYADRPRGVSEAEPLDFHSPYGCSKGAADQYFRDYRRIYGLPTVVFRQSCIYGPHQHGNEDQGWVAHFMKAALAGSGVSIYGDGRQVRDVLFVDDLIAAFEAAYRRRGKAAGEVYNIGGGAANTLSLRELLAWIERKRGTGVPHRFRAWRPGDQRVYVSDIGKAGRELGWKPPTDVAAGLERLWDWLAASKGTPS